MFKKILLTFLGLSLLSAYFLPELATVQAAAPFKYVDLYTVNKSGSTSGRDFKLWGIHKDDGAGNLPGLEGPGLDIFLVYVGTGSCPDYLVVNAYSSGKRFKDSGNIDEIFKDYGILEGPLSSKAWFYDNVADSAGFNGCKYGALIGDPDLFNDIGEVTNNPTSIDDSAKSQIILYSSGDLLLNAGSRDSMTFKKNTDIEYLRYLENDECKDALQLTGAGASKGNFLIRHAGGGGCEPDLLHGPPFGWEMVIGNIASRPDLLEEGDTTGEGGTNEEQDCDAGALSWIVCTSITFVQGISEKLLDNVIKPFLQVSPLKAETDDPIFESWKSIRTLANVFLVPIFFIIIFSQALSLNIDAYTIKKLLPRLVAATIFIQFSFYLVAILVDIFNVLGNGIGELLTSAVGKAELGEIKFRFGEGQSVVAGLGLLVGGGFALASLAGPIFALIVPLMLALLAVVFTLIFRQILIVMLAILAPIALVAWVLPNTSKIFKMWLDNLLRALMMYPMIVALFASAVIMASLVQSASGGDVGFVRNNFQTVAALAITVVPFAAIPMTFKFAGGALGAISGGIQNFRSKGVDKLRESRERPRPGGLRERWNHWKAQTGRGDSRINRVPGFGRVAGVLARPGIGIGGKARSKAITDFNTAVTEAQKTVDGLAGLKPETKAYMATHGYDYKTQAGRRKFNKLIKHLKASGKPDNVAIANQLEGLRQFAGKDEYTTAFANAAMAAGQTGLDMPEEHIRSLFGITDAASARKAYDSGLIDAELDDQGNVTKIKEARGAGAVLQGLAKNFQNNALVGASAVSGATYNGKDTHMEQMMTRMDNEGNMHWALTSTNKKGQNMVEQTANDILGVQEKVVAGQVNLDLTMPHILNAIHEGLKKGPGTKEYLQAMHNVGELRYARNSTKKPQNKTVIEQGLQELTGRLQADGILGATDSIPLTSPPGGATNYLTASGDNPPTPPAGPPAAPPLPPEGYIG